MRKTEITIDMPKDKICILRDFTLCLPCRINEEYFIQCNEKIPMNLRMYLLSELYNNVITIDGNLNFYIDINKYIFTIKQGRKNSFGYSLEDLNLINSEDSLLTLINIDGEKFNIIENIEYYNNKYYRFYINKKIESILFKNLKAENFYSLKLIGNCKSIILDAYIDLISMHFIEGFYRMFPFIKQTPYSIKKEYINNKINLMSKTKEIKEKDIKNILKILKHNSEKINKLIEDIIYKINLEINNQCFIAIPIFNKYYNTQYEKLLSMQVEFKKIENKI